MEQVEVSNKYIDMNVNNDSEKWTGKNTATSDRPFSVFSTCLNQSTELKICDHKI